MQAAARTAVDRLVYVFVERFAAFRRSRFSFRDLSVSFLALSNTNCQKGVGTRAHQFAVYFSDPRIILSPGPSDRSSPGTLPSLAVVKGN